MSVTQTVEIPASHRLTIDVPPEVPTGRAKIIFFPDSADKEPVTEPKSGERGGFGCAKGEFWMADDFDAPLDDFIEP
jgi:hypothetical protein